MIWEQCLHAVRGWWSWCLLGRAKLYVSVLVRKAKLSLVQAKFLPINALWVKKKVARACTTEKHIELGPVHETGECKNITNWTMLNGNQGSSNKTASVPVTALAYYIHALKTRGDNEILAWYSPMSEISEWNRSVMSNSLDALWTASSCLKSEFSDTEYWVGCHFLCKVIFTLAFNSKLFFVSQTHTWPTVR